MISNDSGDQQPYHHGNVREALIDTGLKLIEADAAGTISLRKLSKEVGITPSAVYNHFADKDALLLAIKTRMYDDMNRYFLARLSSTDDPQRALLEMCMAYYHFSNDYPSKFQFLFSSTLPLEWSSKETVKVSCHSILRVRNLVWQIYDKFHISCSESKIVQATLLIWSQVHGIIALRNTGSIPAAVAYLDWPTNCALSRDKEVEELIEDHIAIIVRGILNTEQTQHRH